MEFKRGRELKRTKIEIIPMIDTMFFLLVFFMLSSLALTKLEGLPVNLPVASTAQKQPGSDVTVTIDAQQRLYVNRIPVGWNQLAEEMLRAAGGRDRDLKAAQIIINADMLAPHGLVVRTMDAARSVGLTKFAIATAPEAAGKVN
jgi:biopolymer transport protein ExbD